MHKKNPKICTGCWVSEAKIYLYQSTEIAKARPHSEEWETDTSVQKQWSMLTLILSAQKMLFLTEKGPNQMKVFVYEWGLCKHFFTQNWELEDKSAKQAKVFDQRCGWRNRRKWKW